MYSSHLQKVIAGSALILIACCFLWGCSDSNPTISNSYDIVAARLANPLPDKRAEQLALYVSGELVAPVPLYRQLRSDLAAIDRQYGWLIREASELSSRGPVSDTLMVMLPFRHSIMIYVDSVDARPILDGERPEWTTLMERFAGGEPSYRYNYSSDGPQAILTIPIHECVNPVRVVDEFAGLPEVILVRASRFGFPYSGSAVVPVIERDVRRYYCCISFQPLLSGVMPFAMLQFRFDGPRGLRLVGGTSLLDPDQLDYGPVLTLAEQEQAADAIEQFLTPGLFPWYSRAYQQQGGGE